MAVKPKPEPGSILPPSVEEIIRRISLETAYSRSDAESIRGDLEAMDSETRAAFVALCLDRPGSIYHAVWMWRDARMRARFGVIGALNAEPG